MDVISEIFRFHTVTFCSESMAKMGAFAVSMRVWSSRLMRLT